MIKALAVTAALAAGLFAPAARALDAEAWVAAHPDATVLAAEGVLTIGASGLALEDFLWLARPLVVLADSPNDPRFVQQMEYIAANPAALAERDVVVIVDTDPAARSAVREALRPRGFDLVLIGKDGLKYLRKPLPWDVREISRSIDKMPMRQQELRDRRTR